MSVEKAKYTHDPVRCLDNKQNGTELKSREEQKVLHCHFRMYQACFDMSFQWGGWEKKDFHPSAFPTLGQKVGIKRTECPLQMLAWCWRWKKNAMEGCVWWRRCWWTVSMPPCTCGNGRRVCAPIGNTYVYLLLNVQGKYAPCLPGKRWAWTSAREHRNLCWGLKTRRARLKCVCTCMCASACERERY